MSKALLYHLLNKQVAGAVRAARARMELMQYSLEQPCLMMVLAIFIYHYYQL